MGFLLRLITGCIVFGTMSILIYMSFFYNPKTQGIPDIHTLVQSSGAIQLSSGSTLLQPSVFETLYSDTSLENILQSSGSTLQFNLTQSGVYLSSFYDITKTYVFKGENFTATQLGIGEVFFDTRSVPGKILIFPLTSSVRIRLEESDTQQAYTDIFLTPHMYIEIDPRRVRFLKNADALRIGTIYQLGYLGVPLMNIQDAGILQKYESSLLGFLQEHMQSIFQKNIQQQGQLEFVASQKVSKIPGYERAERYAYMFVNDEKKAIFYKNRILESFIALLHSEKYDAQSVKNLQADLNMLKQINQAAYAELLVFQKDLALLVFHSSEKKYIPAKLLFASLLNEEIGFEKWYFSLYGYTLFSQYDQQKTFSDEGLRDFLTAFQSFIGTQDISSETKNTFYQYFAYFLQRQLSYSLESKGSYISNDALFSLLENYISVSHISYNESVTGKLTSLYIYDSILKDINIFLRSTYFLPERNTQSLLVLSEMKMLPAHVVSLKTSIEKITVYYEENKKFLNTKENTRDTEITKDIDMSIEQMKEHIAALENYQSYTSQYDTSKQNLLNVDVLEAQEDQTLSQEKIQSYLSQFVGLDFSSMKTTLHENYYHIEDIFISGKKLSFDIYPPEYIMKNIEIDGKVSRFIYKLSSIESDWKERNPEGIGQETAYDFSRFFLITFFPTYTASPVEEYVTQEPNTQMEDKTEIVFKREKLLGDKGEFSQLKSFFPIEYQHITVVKTAQNYDIFLRNVPTSMSSSKNSYVFDMSSKYVLNAQDHYFQNISGAIANSGNIGVMFGGQELSLAGKINLLDFQKVLQALSETLVYYQELYTSLSSQKVLDNLTIQYTSYNKKMIFKFDSSGKNYTISLAGSKIDRVYQGTKSLITTPISIKDISKYIQ